MIFLVEDMYFRHHALVDMFQMRQKDNVGLDRRSHDRGESCSKIRQDIFENG